MSDRFCVGFPREYVIDCFTKDGDYLHRIVRTAWDRVQVTRQDRADYFAVEEVRNPEPSGARYLKYLRENAEFAEEFPAFGRLLGAETGELWVGPYVPERETPAFKTVSNNATTWSVYSRAGVWISDVVLPPRFHLMFAGEAK